MKSAYLILAAVLVIGIAACNKDKAATKPKIKISEFTPTEVSSGGTLFTELEFTDKEGDLGQGQLTYIRVRTNKVPIPNPSVNDKIDTFRFALPSFDNKSNGFIQFNVPYSVLDEAPPLPGHTESYPDTMYFRILVRDRAGNVSDTISTPSVIAK